MVFGTITVGYWNIKSSVIESFAILTVADATAIGILFPVYQFIGTVLILAGDVVPNIISKIIKITRQFYYRGV